jgi:hypothetical protein
LVFVVVLQQRSHLAVAVGSHLTSCTISLWISFMAEVQRLQIHDLRLLAERHELLP